MFKNNIGIYAFSADTPTSYPSINLENIPMNNTPNARAFINNGESHNFLNPIFKICVINHDP